MILFRVPTGERLAGTQADRQLQLQLQLQPMSAEEATASVAAAGRLLADLEHASAALSELVRKSPRDDVIESARLSAESQLQSLEEELGALVFAEDYAPAEERNRAEEEGRLDELVLSPEDVEGLDIARTTTRLEVICCCSDRSNVRSGQVTGRFITRPKSRTMRATRQLMLPPNIVSWYLATLE